MRSICRSAGFSLIELMMVLVLVAIFASIAVPSFNALIERNRIQTASEELYSLLQYARSEAVNRHANVSIRATQNNDWAKGLKSSAARPPCKSTKVSSRSRYPPAVRLRS